MMLSKIHSKNVNKNISVLQANTISVFQLQNVMFNSMSCSKKSYGYTLQWGSIS